MSLLKVIHYDDPVIQSAVDAAVKRTLETVRSLNTFIAYNSAPLGKQLKEVSKGTPFKRIVLHGFKENADPQFPMQIIFQEAYSKGKIDSDYVARTRSKNWRNLERTDPLCIALRSQNTRKKDNLYYTPGGKDGETYYQFVIGNNVFGVCFEDDFLENTAKTQETYVYLIMDFVRLVCLMEMNAQFSEQQGIVNNFSDVVFQDVDFNDPEDFKSVAQTTMQLLNDFCGIKSMDVVFPEICTDILNLENNTFSQRLSDACPEDISVAIPLDWGDDKQLLIRYTYSKDRDVLLNKFINPNPALQNFSFYLYKCYMKKKERIEAERKQQELEIQSERIAQERDHLQRIVNIMRVYQSLPQLKAALSEDIKQYFDIPEGAPAPWLTFQADAQLLTDFSDPEPVSTESTLYELFSADKAKVFLHIPKCYRPRYDRHQEWFTNYLSFLTIAMEFFLKQYEMLTGLSTLGLFFKQFNDFAAYLKKYPQARLAVVWADGYKFKMFNECGGHPFGDSILKFWATRLAKLFPLTARVQGDEYLVAFPYFTEENTHLSADRREQLTAAGFKTEQEYTATLQELKKLADDTHVPVYFTDAGKKLFDNKVLVIKLADLVSNFFIKDPQNPELLLPRFISRDKEDLYTEIFDDPNKNLGLLRDQAFAVVLSRYCKLGDKKFARWVWENNPIGVSIKIHPQLSCGTPTVYSSKNLPGYQYAVIEAAEKAWSKSKKQ